MLGRCGARHRRRSASDCGRWRRIWSRRAWRSEGMPAAARSATGLRATAEALVRRASASPEHVGWTMVTIVSEFWRDRLAAAASRPAAAAPARLPGGLLGDLDTPHWRGHWRRRLDAAGLRPELRHRHDLGGGARQWLGRGAGRPGRWPALGRSSRVNTTACWASPDSAISKRRSPCCRRFPCPWRRCPTRLIRAPVTLAVPRRWTPARSTSSGRSALWALPAAV